MNQEPLYEREMELTRSPLNDVEAFLDCARYNEDDDGELLRAYLVEHPRDVDVRDSQGRTAVHMAAANGHMSILEMLFLFNPQPDFPNYEGNTALHFAALNNRVVAAQRLIQKGWKASTLNNGGRTPLQLIQGKNFEEMETVLLEHDDSLDTYVPPAGSGVADIRPVVSDEEEVEGDDEAKVLTSPLTRAVAAVVQPAQSKAPKSEVRPTLEGMLGSADVNAVE